MNNDILINLKNNLKKKIEKKCNKYGYITKIYKILDFSNGEIIAENFNSSAIFDIKYSCRSCIPIEKTNIICKIDLQNKVLIKATNGPIIVIIKINELDQSKFNINNKGFLVRNIDNKIILLNDYVTINIIKYNFFCGDERLIILGNIIDIPTKEDIEKYYDENLNIENNIL